MSHEELLSHGCRFETRRDVYGIHRYGYWLDGVFLGKTPRQATEAIRG